MEPRLTIQLVGWNSAAALPQALGSLRDIPPAAAVIRYLDNASRDDSLALVRRQLPQADVVELPSNRGFAGAHNIGFARCTTPYVLVLNPDAALFWDGVQTLLDVFADPRVGAVQGKIYRDEARRVLDSAGIVMTLALNGVDRGAGEIDAGQFDAAAELAAVTGAAGLYRLAALRQVAHGEDEVFDEDFFAYKEDVDLGWRLRRAGWRVAYQPVPMAIHARSLRPETTARGLHPRRLLARLHDRRGHYSLRNWVWMLVKNMSFRDGLKHELFIDARLLAFAAASVVYWPLLSVWREILRGLPRMAAKRS